VVTVAECGELVGTWPIGEGQIVMDQSICYVVCPFQVVFQCVVIRGVADCAYIIFTSSTCVLSIDSGHEKRFRTSFDFVLTPESHPPIRRAL